MQWSASCVLLAVMVYGGGGVTKPSSIEQFWTDDYKIFEQVYGKTSDRDIYGETLPSTITFTSDKKKDPIEKNERYLYNEPDFEPFESFNFGERYKNLLGKHSLKLLSPKPAAPTVDFIGYSSFQPISQTTDPDTYNYLKHLEEFSKEDKYNFPETKSGFKPYLSYGVTDSDEADAYRSIQDILDAHEANKDSTVEEENSMKYLTYPKNKKKKPLRAHNEVTKPRCPGGRCRKRAATRSRTRPYRRPTVKTVVVI